MEMFHAIHVHVHVHHDIIIKYYINYIKQLLPHTGTSKAQSSPPSLQLSCRHIFVATLISICFLLSVRDTIH